jgi:signal transduction histidine kinase
MVVQAEAADAVFDRDPISVRDALKSIQSSGREALVDLRRMLGVLREAPTSPVAPQPSLARLGELADQMRTAGLDIDVRIEGPSLPLPRGLDLAAYRIVQEALTNVLKHAGRERVHVLVRYAPDHVELEVCNDGRRVKLRNGGGHGLAGISERVAVFGGSYEAAPRPEGGFVVRVRLPIGSSV